MQRIAIVGCCGAGKSVLARALGDRLGLPIVHLDQLFWKPGWVESEREEFAAAQRLSLPIDGRWIADGNYGGTMEIRIAAADTIVFLDLPTWLCLWRVIARRVTHGGRVRSDMAPGCPERFWDPSFPEFLRYVARYRRDQRPELLARLKDLRKDQRAVILRSPREVQRFALTQDTSVISTRGR